MIRLLWNASTHTRAFLRRYMPTNILLDSIRTRRGLKWGAPAILLAVPYLLAASICTNVIADGGPGWLNLLVLLFLWNSMKFIIMGPVSLILLARVRMREILTGRAERLATTRTGQASDLNDPYSSRCGCAPSSRSDVHAHRL